MHRVPLALAPYRANPPRVRVGAAGAEVVIGGGNLLFWRPHSSFWRLMNLASLGYIFRSRSRLPLSAKLALCPAAVLRRPDRG